MKITQAFGGFSSCTRSILPDVGKYGYATVRVESDFATMQSSVTRTYRTMDTDGPDHHVPPDTCTEQSPCVDDIDVRMSKGVDISAR